MGRRGEGERYISVKNLLSRLEGKRRPYQCAFSMDTVRKWGEHGRGGEVM